MYRPNFCSDCGARIDRARWRLWTSTRFCAKCEKRFRKAALAVPLMAGVILLIGAYIAGRAGRVHPPPVVIERAETRSPHTPISAASSMGMTGAGSGRKENSPGVLSESLPESGETALICGARTQKGKPCSRRVRGTGRCWQHKGKSAMLPLEKLVIQE
ncbi:MAG TPA: hypothetical protein VM943_12715 [Pyrinomonadaceae bacterium]|nr:hypothetical protein [Pyrinomonadaceae bacterium]